MIRMASGIEKSTATGEEVNTMRINYGATDRKRMVKAIGEALDEKPVYQGIPSYAYQIAEFTVTRDGNLEFPDDTDPEIVNGLLDALEEAGFQFPENEEHAVSEGTEACTDEDGSVTTEENAVEVDQLETPTELTISLPTMESVALERLQKLVDSKASLIQKALNITDGFVHGGTNIATVADQYKTYNLEVSKAITGRIF